MLFNKLFEKSFKYIYFDNLKKDVIKTRLTKKEVGILSEEEFSTDLKILKQLIIQLSESLNNFEENLFSFFNQKVYQALKQEIIILSEEVNEFSGLNYPYYNNSPQSGAPVFIDSKAEIQASFNKNKDKYHHLVSKFRELFKTFISLITNKSWQSPDFGYSLFPQHGIFQEKVYSFYNDYQRYRANTIAIEKSFNSEYKIISGINSKTWVFSCGMGSFTTLLQTLPDFHNACKIAGNNLYFEVLSFLKYQKNIFFFHEENTEEIISFIKENKPEYLFFDPVANSGKLVTFNFIKLFEYYKNNLPENPVSIIIDTTLTIHLFQIAEFFPGSYPDNLNIFLYRSIQKLDQYGLDLVTGGIITHYGNMNIPLDSFRQLGTTPTETEVLTLEYLGSEFTENRFIRHGRNAFIIADFLNNIKNKKESIIENIYHPLLKKNHLFNSYLQTPLFFFSLKDYFNLEDYNFFLKELFRIAGIRKFNIIAGTSFGFNCSRIMITTFPDSPGTCFRFSPGTEVLQEVYILLEIFGELINTFILNLKIAYEKNELPLFQNKLELYNKSLEKMISEKQLEEDYLKAVIHLIDDINKHLLKFKNYKVTRKFYNEKIEQIVSPLLQISNRPDIDISDNLKKEIIRSIAAILESK